MSTVRIVRAGVAAACAAAWLACAGGTAAANWASVSGSAWTNMGYLQWRPHADHPICGMDVDAVWGTPGPVFGEGTVWGAATTQYVSAQIPPLSLPTGATLVGGSVSGAVVESDVNGSVAPAGAAAFTLGGGLGIEYGFGVCPGLYPSTLVHVTLPGNATQAVPFGLDAYSLLQTIFSGQDVASGDLAMAGGPWMAPDGPFTLSIQYAFTPAGLTAAVAPSGTGTQAAVTWSPNGNEAGTMYELQRAVVGADGAPGAWSTLYDGEGTEFTTGDQSCGQGYVYRVAAVGPHAATPWDTSAQWDSYPCGLQIVGATDASVTVSWSAEAPGTQPEVVWCAAAAPDGATQCRQSALTFAPGTGRATLTGLSPNTDYAVWACSVGDAWGCPEASVWTLAAPPTGLTALTGAAGVPFNAQPLQWSAAGNPPGTVYEVQRLALAPDGSPLGPPADVYRGPAAAFTAAQDAGASYVYRVVALNWGYGSATAPSAAVPVQVASVPTLRATGPGAVSVSWASVSGVDQTQVACAVASDAAPGGAGWVTEGTVTGGGLTLSVAGLTPDTPYVCAVAALAANRGIPWPEASAAVYTGAAQPVSLQVRDVTPTSAEAVWASGGNPAGTVYEVRVSAADGSRAAEGETTADAYAVQGLQPGAAYVFEVRARNSGGTWTAWTVAAAVVTVPGSPEVSGSAEGLGWSSAAGRGYVDLAWNPVPGASGYRVWVFDGAQYEAFDVGTATRWSSTEARIFPPDAALYPEVAAGSKAPPLFSHDGGGLDLRDRPGDLYCTAGTYYCGGAGGRPENYWFTVSAYNASGDSATFAPPGDPSLSYYEPTLPLQTDPAAPQVTGFSLSTGDAGGYAFGPDVAYALQALESPAGVAAYALSNDGTAWTVTAAAGCAVGQVAACPSALRAAGTWTLTAGPGTKTVYAKVESVAGVWSPPVSATIYVEPDTRPPVVDLVLDGGNPRTAGTTVTVRTNVTDPVAAQAHLDFRSRYSVDGGQTWSAWQPQGAATVWTAGVVIPGGDPGERSVLEQVEDSDLNLAQAAAAIEYVGAAGGGSGGGGSGGGGGGGTGGASSGSGAGIPCTWEEGGRALPAVCVTDSRVSVALRPPVGAVEMRASLDGVLWGPWSPAAGSLQVDFGAAPGPKSVWVQFRDAAGVVTAQPVLRYVYDPAPPSVQASWLGDASATDPTGRAVLEIAASDDAGPAAALSVVVREDGGTLYTGPLDDVLPVQLNGAGYQVVEVTVTDAGGNATSVDLGIFVE